MHLRYKFIIVLLFLIFLNVSVVTACEDNATDVLEIQCEDEMEIECDIEAEEITKDVSEVELTNLSQVEKTTPTVTISSNKLNSKDTLEIYLKTSSSTPISSKKLSVNFNGKSYSLTTDSNGAAKLGINLAANSYKLTVSFAGDNNYTAVSKTFNIKVYKLKTKLVESANFVVKGNNLYFHLIDSNGDSVAGKKIKIRFNGKTYTKKSNSHGCIGFKVNVANKKYTVKVSYNGDKQFKSSSKKLKFYVTTSRSINLANSKMLTNGFVRVYLKIAGKAVSKNVILSVAGKKISKKSNSEGIVIFKPNAPAGHFTIKAKVGKYYSSKPIKCYNGDAKDPLKESVPYKNGKPDVDLMSGNYVMGDENAKYTLKKSQYREVLKRDSYCLFLNGKLTKYTFFKTKNHPNLNHIIKREKWNVIERAINTQLVKKNKYNYWPGKVTVSLKGKSYKYPEVRDPQNTGYTCGPASCSMCSQVLKNYVNEKYISKLAGTTKLGTSCPNMIKALAKNNFKATYFYKSTFSNALNELKNGGCALVFHANNHYVSILDISKNGKKVLVSNSYGSYDNIPTKWVKVSFMKNKFSPKWSESLIIKLDYKLSDSTKNSINSYYSSMGANWVAKNTHQTLGKV